MEIKKFDTWKIQLSITINFVSSKDDNDEGPVMYSKNDKLEIMINDETRKIRGERFKLILNRYQDNLEKLMKCSDFVFNYVCLLYNKCHILTS